MKLPFWDRLSIRFISLLIILFLHLILGALPCQGKEISVELVWKFREAAWVQIQIEQGSYILRETIQGEKLEGSFPSGSRLELAWGGWTPVLKKNYNEFQIWRGSSCELMDQGSHGVFSILTPDGQRVRYRGSLSLNWESDHWKLINRVEQEDYLKGVVPIEMSNQWGVDGLEALKAQAVAARTYMVRKIQGNSKITDSPDIDQAYLGMNVEGIATKAVECTHGQVLVDSLTGTPIDALYSSHNGGYTELAENVWGNQDTHFISQPDPFSDGIGGAANRWRFIVGADFLGQSFTMGPIKHIELDKLPSGRVKKVSMLDIYGKLKSVSGREFVKAFYPYGQPIQAQSFLGILFDVSEIPSSEGFSFPLKLRTLVFQQKQKTNSGPRLDRIISSAQGVRETSSPYGVFIFNGRGWGHGVGMSQWGAYHMAQRGSTYQEILDFYYVRTKLTQVNP